MFITVYIPARKLLELLELWRLSDEESFETFLITKLLQVVVQKCPIEDQHTPSIRHMTDEKV